MSGATDPSRGPNWPALHKLAVPTVHRLSGELLRQELLVEGKQRRGGLGKPPLELSVNPQGGYSVGFNFDRDRLVGVLTDLTGTVLQRLHVELGRATPAEVFSRTEEMTQTFLKHPDFCLERFLGIGVGVPGPLHLGPVSSANLFNLPGWEGLEVADQLSERLGFSIVLENNSVAAAIGEMWYGEGRLLENFFFIFFGFYLGGCAVLGREPNRGHGGFGGEFGSVPYGPYPHSPDGVARLGHKVSLAGLYSTLGAAGLAAPQAEDLEQLYREQNPALLGWLGEAVEYLAPELLRIEYLLDPEAIIFGERLPEVLFNHLIVRLEAHLGALRLNYKPYGPKLLRGRAGIDAAAVGAAALPLYQLLEPNPTLFLQQTSAHSKPRRSQPKGFIL